MKIRGKDVFNRYVMIILNLLNFTQYLYKLNEYKIYLTFDIRCDDILIDIEFVFCNYV